MKPICKDECSLFYRYLHFVFAPKLTEDFPDFSQDPMSGSISLNQKGLFKGKPFDVVYCSPMWEGELNTITCEFYNDGEYVGTDKTQFPINGWTMNVEDDVKEYVCEVYRFLKDTRV